MTVCRVDQVTVFFILFSLLKGSISTFIDNPADITALTNSPTSLSCSVHDEHPLPSSIVWFKDDVAKSSDERIGISYNSSTGYSTYKILNVLYADAGDYVCRAYNSTDGLLLESSIGTITVEGLPAFDPPLPAQTVASGSTATLNCKVLSNPSATITWTFNNNALTGTAQITISGGKVTIANVQSSNDGFYRCSAKNSYGTNSTQAKLTVQTKSDPTVTIAETPEDPDDSYQVAEGGNLVLNCNVEGEGISLIEWRKTFPVNSTIDGDVTVTEDSSTLSFTSITSSDGGMYIYTCSANTTTGGYDKKSINIEVITAPVVEITESTVVKQANSTYNSLSDSDTPDCTLIEGNGLVTFKWTDNNGDVNSQASLELSRVDVSFSPLQASDNGNTYTCTASNFAGSDSASFTLDVQYAPSITTSALLQAVYGDDVFIPCEVDANPSPTTEWTRGLQEEALTGHYSITKQGLTLYDVAQEDTNVYNCMATNTVGNTSVPFTLNITLPPSIQSITPSEDFYQPLGSSINIRCQSAGPADLNVTWYHNGTELEDKGRVSMPDQFNLVIASVTFSDSGVYTCNASYYSHFAFAIVEATVGVGPTIATLPQDLNVTQSEETLIPCIATGVPQPKIVWYRTGIVNSIEEQLDDIADTHRYETTGLRLLNPLRSDTGTYRCEASNAISMAIASANIVVEGEPQVTDISPTHLIAGQTSTLTCATLFNYPPASFNWTQGENHVDPTRFTVHSNGDLVISPVVPEDQQQITCRAFNKYGVSFVSGDITVDFKPVVSFSRTHVHLILNTNLTIKCSSTSRPGSSSLEIVLPSGNKALSFQFNPSSGVLDINKVTQSFKGIYTCFSTNYLGTGNGTVEVTAEGAPPHSVTSSSTTSTSALVSWRPPVGSLADSLKYFTLRYGRMDEQERITLNTSLTELLHEGLEEFTEYIFEVQSVFTDGILSSLVNTSVLTLQDAPSAPPDNVSLSAIIEGIQISWEAPAIADRNGILEGYNIWYRISRPSITSNGTERMLYNETFELIVFDLTSESDEQFNLTGLGGGRTYDIVIQAFTVIGAGPGSNIKSIKTKKAFPLTIVLANVIPVGTIIVVVLLVLAFVGLYFCFRRLKRVGRLTFSSEKDGKQKIKRKRKRNVDISDPKPEYPPEIDMTKKSKFTLHHEDGSTVPSHPRVIQPSDVSKKRWSGATVISRRESDPYENPDRIIDQNRKRSTSSRGDPKRDGFVARDSKGSRIYEEPTSKKKTRPPREPTSRQSVASTSSYGETDGDVEDDELPVELPVAFEWGSGPGDEEEDYSEDEEEEEAPRVVLRNKKGERSSRLESVVEESEDDEEESEEESEEEEPPTPPAATRRRSDQENLYATVSNQHKAMKRSQILKEKMKQQEKQRKEKEKREEKRRKELKKQKKKTEKAKKKEMKDRMKRQSLGLDNIVNLADIAPSSRAGYSRQMRRSIDSSSANLF